MKLYIIHNEAYHIPGKPPIYKIGITSGDVNKRVNQLYNTGVPLPFEIVAAFDFQDKPDNSVRNIESSLHCILERVNRNREFVFMDDTKLNAVISLIQSSGGISLELNQIEQDVNVTNGDIEQVEMYRKRKGLISYYGLNEGQVIYYKYDRDITCKVVSDNKVMYENELLSLSVATRLAARKTKNQNQSEKYQGSVYWETENGIKVIDNAIQV